MKNKFVKIPKTVISFILCVLTLSLVSCATVVSDKSQPDNDSFEPKNDFQIEKKFDNDDQSNVNNVEITYTLKYYDVIEDAEKEFTETKSFENEIAPEYFIQKLSELMNTSISVNSINFDEEKLFIDFASDSSPLGGTGSYEESCILDSISDVFLDIFPEINEIHITADGKDYDSGHTVLPKDIPYATRQEKKVG